MRTTIRAITTSSSVKRFVITFAALLCLSGGELLAQAEPPKKLHIYLLIGQSNMSGRAPIEMEDQAPLEDCYLLNGQDQWELAKHPYNAHSTIRKALNVQKLNPGYTFAKTMLAKNPDTPIGLVVNAKGGSKIEEWKKGARFYNEILRRAKVAQAGGEIKGILWHQGESNAGKPEIYLDQLKELVGDLRNDLGMAELPFVAGQINGKEPINDQLAKLPEVVPHTACVSSEGLTAMDRWHFDNKSMKLLGERYAEKMIELLGKP